MRKLEDLTGQRFGRLTVLSRNFEKQKEIYETKNRTKIFWNCICDCGNNKVVASSALKNKTHPTLSCGCYGKEKQRMSKNTKENEWILNEKDNIAIGKTFNGIEFYVDLEDYEKVKNYCWRCNQKGYVIAFAKNGTNDIVWLHRLIMNENDENILIDHENWNKRDNRKCNLRRATKSQNNINIKRKINNTTGYTGVTLNKRSGKYVSRISINGIRYNLGTYGTFEEAVKARHDAELSMHGNWSGEINRKDFQKIIKDTSDAPDMEEAEELIIEEN